MPKVYVTDKIPEEGIRSLRQKGFSVEINDTGKNLSIDLLKKVFKNYDAVITLVSDKINTEIISAASSKLKIISNYGVGYDNINVVEANRKGISVTNTPGVASESVAEFTFALILACAKQLTSADKYVRLGKYKRWQPLLYVAPQIWGKTIGIVGLGKIGMLVGQMAYGGFRMNILYHDIVRSEDFELLTEENSKRKKKAKKDVLTLNSDKNLEFYRKSFKEQAAHGQDVDSATFIIMENYFNTL